MCPVQWSALLLLPTLVDSSVLLSYTLAGENEDGTTNFELAGTSE
jgi:hypothetical protein